MRKAPRIISRKRVHTSLGLVDQQRCSSSNDILDIDDEFDEGVIVRGGVMMRVLSSDDSSSNVAVSSNKTFDNNSHQQPMQFPRHITVEAPPLSYDSNEQPYVEHPLPGIADEVESYPCRHCPDRIFLTAFGLERHTKMAHPEAINEALADIENIQQEWKRREKERNRQRERVALVKLRQEALTNVVARGRDAAFHDNISHSNSLQFQPCRICGIYINAQHQSAIINHIRAHSKNDQLRNNMLMEFGQQFVERVTCRECNLVFTDEQKLYAHIGLMHSRRRKYVCKWCGHVCMSMADLNVHKGDVHGMPVTRNRVEELRKRGAGVQLHITNNSNHHNNKKGVNIESSSRNGNSNDTHNNDANRNAMQTLNLSTAIVNNSRTTNSSSEVNNSISSSNIIYSTNNSTSTVKLTPLMEDTPCRTSCELCGLVMVKPSLLIRHMLRVHNRQSFSAIVHIRGMPNIRADVNKGRVTWWCCQTAFFDRYQFIYHRRSCHQPKYEHFSFNNAAAASIDSNSNNNNNTDGINSNDNNNNNDISNKGTKLLTNILPTSPCTSTIPPVLLEDDHFVMPSNSRISSGITLKQDEQQEQRNIVHSDGSNNEQLLQKNEANIDERFQIQKQQRGVQNDGINRIENEEESGQEVAIENGSSSSSTVNNDKMSEQRAGIYVLMVADTQQNDAQNLGTTRNESTKCLNRPSTEHVDDNSITSSSDVVMINDIDNIIINGSDNNVKMDSNIDNDHSNMMLQQIALTPEQYEQLRMQIDADDLNNMQVVFMDECDDEEEIEAADAHEEIIEATLGETNGDSHIDDVEGSLVKEDT